MPNLVLIMRKHFASLKEISTIPDIGKAHIEVQVKSSLILDSVL